MILGVSAFVAVIGLIYLNSRLGFARFPSLIGLGLATLARVVILLAISTVIWVPVGVKIGMSPSCRATPSRSSRSWPAFPAILLFPFATLIFIDLGISLNYGAILLMMLGAQWYILFNVIAGASSIPNDLREMMVSMRLTRRQRWRQVILPAIFPAYVTGGITAAGRSLERIHRGRAGQLAPPHSQRLRARQLHRHCIDSGKVRPPHRRWHRDERIRRHRQSAVLAAPVSHGRKPVHAVSSPRLTPSVRIATG